MKIESIKADIIKYIITFFYSLKYGCIFINKSFHFRFPYFYFKNEVMTNGIELFHFSLVFPTEICKTKLVGSTNYRVTLLGFGLSITIKNDLKKK